MSVIRRSRNIDNEIGAVFDHAGYRINRVKLLRKEILVIPNVLTDGQPYFADLIEKRRVFRAWFKISGFVKDVIGRKESLVDLMEHLIFVKEDSRVYTAR